MAEYVTTIDGTVKEIQPGWKVSDPGDDQTIFTFEVLSKDGTYRPDLDDEVIHDERVVIVSSSVANPSVITTAEAHGYETGQLIGISSHSGSTPDINGYHFVTVVDETHYSIAVNVTVGGTGGVSGRRIFGGTIMDLEERGLANEGVVPIVTKVVAKDNNSILKRRYINTVFASGSLFSQLDRLVDDYLYEDGVVLHPSQATGPTVAELPCDWASAESIGENLSLQTQYSRDLDYHKYLLFKELNAAVITAPFNITEANQAAIGDIKVRPTREGYANRIILRYSNVPQFAYGFFYIPTGGFTEGEQITVGGQTYEFRNSYSDTSGYVVIAPGDVETTLARFEAAVRGAGGRGSTYAESTPVNSSVTAYHQQTYMTKVRALTAGASGNSITATETCANGSFVGEGLVALGGTLYRGFDSELTNVSIQEDAAEIAAHGIWETVFQAPDITSQTLADTMCQAILDAHIVLYKIVDYKTYKIGLRSNQVQTITTTKRNLSGAFLVTDVITHNHKGNRVLHTVQAVSSLIPQSAYRWRDKYKTWDGRLSTDGTVVGGSLPTVPSTAANKVYPLGGSPAVMKSSATPTWVDATGFLVSINTAERSSSTATVTALLWAADAGIGVTARLYNVTTDTPLTPTSTQITSTTITITQFNVTLTDGVNVYKLQILPSAANKRVGAMGYVE